MFRDTNSSTRCIIKLATAIRKKQAMSDLGRSVLGHGLIGTSGGLIIGSMVGKDKKSPAVGAVVGGVAGGIGGLTDHLLRRARIKKLLSDDEKMKRDASELALKLGIDTENLKDVSPKEVGTILQAKRDNFKDLI